MIFIIHHADKYNRHRTWRLSYLYMYFAKPVAVVDAPASLQLLKRSLLQFCFFNFFLVAALGVLMRAFPLLPSIPLNYTYLVHGHSHFAFGGWVMPVLVWMILQYLPSVSEKISFYHWRNIIFLLLFSAYGMLLSFPFEGYGLVSIIFSTLSVGAGFYLAVVLLKASKEEKEKTSIRFLRSGLFYLCISAIGPFATGPLTAVGKQGSAIYFDAIYFYLHFQYNGWFTFAVLAILYSLIEKNTIAKNGKKVWALFNVSCLPAFLLSTLWHHPPIAFYYVGGIAALMQVIGILYLLKDFSLIKTDHAWVKSLMVMSIAAFALKNGLQFLSAFPVVADMAYQTRHFIIAYLHLVLLGFVSLFAVASIIKTHIEVLTFSFKTLLVLFLISFVVTESLLVVQASSQLFGFYLSSFSVVIFYISCLFPVALFGMYWNLYRNFNSKERLV